MGLMLEVRDVAKSYGSTRALVSCRLDGQRGSIHCLLGENGSGKSTLVKMLSGVVPPNAGTIVIDGEPVRAFTPKHLQRLGVGTVFQELMNAPNRSVLDNIWLGRGGWLAYGQPRRARVAAARVTLDRLGAADIGLDMPAGRLPLSAQQVVAIARALVQRPKILILDEATSALDIDKSRQLITVLREELADRDMVALFISHRMSEVMELADYITVLKDGRTMASVPRGDANIPALVAMMRKEAGNAA